jgi:predicted CoA-binding protein
MNATTRTKVAILGASNNSDRYSHMLLGRLRAKGHEVFPINPALKDIDGAAVYPNIEALPKGIDVLSVYMNAQRSDALAESLLASGIPKVIFNPGAENPDLQKRLEAKGIAVLEACSLVLSGIDQI